MKKRIRLTESNLHRIVKETVKRVLAENEELFQVNIYEDVDGYRSAFVSRYSEDGYVGVTRGTTYSDGWDETDWCVYVGSKEECEAKADELNSRFRTEDADY